VLAIIKTFGYTENMNKKPMTASEMGKKGGKKRMSLLTPEQRKELATKASHSRKIYKDKNK
jgi:general stress protein YciG